MNKEDYNKYYIQGSDHCLIPKDIFDELFNEMSNWKEEAKDYEIFLAITSEMIDENVKCFIDQQNLRYIDDCLTYFEREYCSDRTKKGKPLIKEQYLHRNHFMV